MKQEGRELMQPIMVLSKSKVVKKNSGDSLNRLRMMRNRQTREASSIGKAPGTSAETAIDVGLTKESNFKQPGASRYEV